MGDSMKKKKIFLAILIIILIVVCVVVFYSVFASKDKKSTLTLIEKQWIDNNKNNIMDFGIVNSVSVLNDSGEGLFFDFIESIEEDTGLSFNKISYDYGEDIKQEYSFGVVSSLKENDILVYSDNYVLVGKENVKFNNKEEINSATVGVIEGKMEFVNKYLDVSGLKFSSYKTIDELFEIFGDDDTDLDYIVIPKLIYISKSLEYKDLYINYNINELKDNYAIRLGKTKKLNNIIMKYYDKWKSEKYDSLLASEITNAYFTMSEIEKQAEVKFKSKRYKYGFVENAPFDIEVNGKLIGINSAIIKSFANISNVEISFESYPSVERLREAFASGKIDFYFNKYNDIKYDLDYFKTVSNYDEQIVVVSKYDNNITLNSIYSLENIDVLTLKNTMIEEQLKKVNANVKSYGRVLDLLRKINNTSIVVIDETTYNFYRNSYFSDFKVDLRYSLNDNYSYIIRNISNNEVFIDFFNFYLSFMNEKQVANIGYHNAVVSTSNDSLLKNIITIVGSFLCIIIAFLLGSKFMPNKTKKKKINMKKEDKLRYVDMLTSLKNRNYLNDNIEMWDLSEIYPQSIIIVDLNNIAYINDNYGHQEGDEVIKQAANILISNQMPNSDIIRTNGNEFLIYMVEYDEKQISAYIKKLNKEFKELAHGFGAAIGYSMITDGIKTIDDAVNEATLDMRNNKEEANN